METIVLTPNYVNVAKYMANVLRFGSFDSDEAKYEFSTQYQEILSYLKQTDPDGWKSVIAYSNHLADMKDW
jgi:hypothetical protein